MPIRGLGLDEIPPAGGFITKNCNYTLATYTAGGVYVPTVGDYVQFSNAANSLVVMAADSATNIAIGRVVAVNTTDLTVLVEWLNVWSFVKLPCDDMTTITLGNAVIKDGNTTVPANFDGGAAVGNMIAIDKSSTAAVAGYVLCAVVIAGMQ